MLASGRVDDIAGPLPPRERGCASASWETRTRWRPRSSSSRCSPRSRRVEQLPDGALELGLRGDDEAAAALLGRAVACRPSRRQLRARGQRPRRAVPPDHGHRASHPGGRRDERIRGSVDAAAARRSAARSAGWREDAQLLVGHHRGEHQGAARPDARPPRVRGADGLPAAAGVFAFGIYLYLKQQAAIRRSPSGGAATSSGFPGGRFARGRQTARRCRPASATPCSAACCWWRRCWCSCWRRRSPPAPISLEREKQTIDLLVTTPLSTLGMVHRQAALGARLRLPADPRLDPAGEPGVCLRRCRPRGPGAGYALLFALAFGMGAIGLFISALVRRTQTATVHHVRGRPRGDAREQATYEFWRVITTQAPAQSNGFVAVQTPSRPPEALLWLNPFVGDADLICTTAPGGYEPHTCDYVAARDRHAVFRYPTRPIRAAPLVPSARCRW